MFKINDIEDHRKRSDRHAGAASGGSGKERWHRLARHGARSLAPWEVLSVVLGPGGRMHPDDAARSLISRFGCLENLAGIPAAVLSRQPGLGPARAGRLLAALELGIRASQPVDRPGPVVRCPLDLHPLLREEFRGLDRERFLALYLDTRHRVEAVETVSVGSLNASLVHPREVFKTAVAGSAAAVIVAHNHPSGCARPSGDDLDLTARLDRCGELLGISLLDHLVAGDREIVSIREYGWPVAAKD